MPRTSQGTDASGNVTTQTHHLSQPIIEPAELFKLDEVFNRQRGLQHCAALLLAGGVGGALVRVVPWWQREDAELVRAGIEAARAQQTALVAA
jgi:hypothetical protein